MRSTELLPFTSGEDLGPRHLSFYDSWGYGCIMELASTASIALYCLSRQTVQVPAGFQSCISQRLQELSNLWLESLNLEPNPIPCTQHQSFDGALENSPG